MIAVKGIGTNPAQNEIKASIETMKPVNALRLYEGVEVVSIMFFKKDLIGPRGADLSGLISRKERINLLKVRSLEIVETAPRQ
jgi:hypothetical protein